MNNNLEIDKLGKKSFHAAIFSGLSGIIVLLALLYSFYQLNFLEEKKSKIEQELSEKQEILANLKKEIDTNNLELNKLNKNLQEAKGQLPLGTISKALDSAINSTRQIELRMGVAAESTKDVYKEKLFYVIAMTSSTREDIENEINRVKKKVGTTFEEQFPDIEPYAPEGGLWTLLISGKSLPSTEANKLKQRAIKAGFSKDTWLWQSGVYYFSSKKQ